jgi:hypothetical protein
MLNLESVVQRVVDSITPQIDVGDIPDLVRSWATDLPAGSWSSCVRDSISQRTGKLGVAIEAELRRAINSQPLPGDMQ